MEKIREELKKEAKDRHGKITPSGNRKSLDECFTEHGGELYLWFNVEDKSTKLLKRNILLRGEKDN